MNGRRRRLPFLHRLDVGGGSRGALVLLLDPGDLVVLAGLPRHRGRYLSHLYLRVKRSLIRERKRAARASPVVKSPRDRDCWPLAIASNILQTPSPRRGLRSREDPLAPAAAYDASRDLTKRAESAHAFKCDITRDRWRIRESAGRLHTGDAACARINRCV